MRFIEGTFGKFAVISIESYASVMLLERGRSMAVVQADHVSPGIFYKSACWWIARAFVHETKRGKGIGSAMLLTLLAEISGMSSDPVVVAPGGYSDDIDRQRKFYISAGFLDVAEEPGLLLWCAPGKSA